MSLGDGSAHDAGPGHQVVADECSVEDADVRAAKGEAIFGGGAAPHDAAVPSKQPVSNGDSAAFEELEKLQMVNGFHASTAQRGQLVSAITLRNIPAQSPTAIVALHLVESDRSALIKDHHQRYCTRLSTALMEWYSLPCLTRRRIWHAAPKHLACCTKASDMLILRVLSVLRQEEWRSGECRDENPLWMLSEKEPQHAMPISRRTARYLGAVLLHSIPLLLFMIIYAAIGPPFETAQAFITSRLAIVCLSAGGSLLATNFSFRNVGWVYVIEAFFYALVWTVDGLVGFSTGATGDAAQSFALRKNITRCASTVSRKALHSPHGAHGFTFSKRPAK